MKVKAGKYWMTLAATVVVCLSCKVQSFGTDPDSPSAKVIWTAPGFVSGQPAADQSTVYFGTVDHQLVAVDRATGAPRWSVTTGAPTPKTLNGLNVLLVQGLAIFGDYNLYALDRSTGAKRWTFDPEALGVGGFAPGAYEESTDGSTVYAGSGAGYVYAVNASDGTLQWANPLSAEGHTSIYDPVIDGTKLYVTVRHFTNPITGSVYALNRSDGRVLWAHTFQSKPPTGSGPLDKVVPYRNTVIVSNDDGKIYGLDAQTGQEVWIAPRRPDVAAYDDDRPIVVSGDVVVAASTTRFVTGYDATNGKQLWEFDAGQGSSSQTMTVDGQTVFVTYLNGTLAAVDALTGAKRWLRSAPSKGYFLAYPLVTDVVFAPSSVGLVAMEK